jgi:uroporphyrinogen decarboxylase
VNKRDRIAATLAGRPVDRVPVSAWGHFFLEETNATTFADRMLSFQETFDWDFLKVHARASYHVEPFGFRYRASRSAAEGHDLLHTPVREPEDWLKLRPVPIKSDAFQEQFHALARMRAALPNDVPIIMTVFTPLDIADKMLDRNAATLAEHVRSAPEAVGYALSVFSETLKPFVAQLVEFGVDGIFFSTKWANGAKLSPRAYRKLCLAHDLHMMAPAASLPINIMHVCESEIFLEAFADYPVSVFHWNDCGRNNPSLRAGRVLTEKAVGGGIDVATLAEGTPVDVERRAVSAILEAGGTGMILSPGCSLRVAATASDNLRALRASPKRAAEALELQRVA